MLGQLGQVVSGDVRGVWKLGVLLLAQDRSGRVLGDVRHQAVQLGEGLVASVAVVVVLPLELAERPAAALVRSVEGVR